jgi:hypothetical protein
MKRIVLTVLTSVCLLSLAGVASADTLILRDGTRIEGTVVSFASRTITFRHANGTTHTYKTAVVEALEFLSPERTTPERTPMRGMTGTSGRTADPRNRTIEAPAGTELAVRTVDAIDSRATKPSQKYAAIVENDVKDADGNVLIPADSRVQLIIREMTSGGTTGSPEMMLDVDTMTVDGRRYVVSTTDLSQDSDTGIGANKRTAEHVGGGAVLGTMIGAIAGGGKGAALGGLIGAAGGAGAQVLTRGQDVIVPSETVLKFRLDRAVTLQLER